MHQQNLLFDGFMRMEIVNNLSENFTKIIAPDVIKLCHKFYIRILKSLMNDTLENLKSQDSYWWIMQPRYAKHAAIHVLDALIDKFIEHYEFFMAIRILKAIVNLDPSPTDAVIQYNYGINFKSMCEYELALQQFKKKP